MLVLKSSPEFRTVAKNSRRWNAPAFILQVMKAPDAPFRVGFTASRKVGGAVVRNRAKRRLREMVRLGPQDLRGADVVIIAKTAATTCDFQKMCDDFARGLKEMGVTA